MFVFINYFDRVGKVAFVLMYDVEQLLKLHEQRHKWTHDRNKIIKNLSYFEQADTDFDPNCLWGKHWRFIKDDFEDFVNNSSK